MAADLIADDKGIAGTLPRRVLGRKKGRKHSKAARRQSGGEIVTTAELSSETPLEQPCSAQSPELSSAEHMPEMTAAVIPASDKTLSKPSASSPVSERAKPSRDDMGRGEEPQCSSPSEASRAISSQHQQLSDISEGKARDGDEPGAWNEVLGHTRRRQLRDQHVGKGAAVHSPLDRGGTGGSTYGGLFSGNRVVAHVNKGDKSTRLQGMAHTKHTDEAAAVERPSGGSVNIDTRSGAGRGGAQGDASVRDRPTYSSALNSTRPASGRNHSGLRVQPQQPQVLSTAQRPLTNIASRESSPAIPLIVNQSVPHPTLRSRPESTDQSRDLMGEASHGHHLTQHAGFSASVGTSENPSGAQELAWVEVRCQCFRPPH